MLSFLHPLSLSLTVKRRRRRRRMKMSILPDAYSHSLTYTSRRRRRRVRRRTEFPTFLPHEIMENIFTRLPVKSIARFRCVSKYWRHQFQNPNFIENHLNLAVRINNFNVLFIGDSYGNVLSSTSSPSLSRIDYPYKGNWGIIGSSHGLVCIQRDSLRKEIYIWNPATREYKLVPQPLADPFGLRLQGFGFDCKNNDYKLLGRVYKQKEKVCEARIYSLASNSWKNIGFIPYDFPYWITEGFLLNGVLHWIATHINADLESPVIVCFDISDETFYHVPFPPCDFDHHSVPFLGVWEGKLCILHHIPRMENPDHIDVWTMMNNKWSKHLKITALVAGMEYIRPIETLPNGEILFEAERVKHGLHLISYDPKLERSRALNMRQGFRGSPYREVEIYIETLVALNSGTYVGQYQRSKAKR